MYPNLVRQSIRAGSQLLTTITNDAWFGDSSAPYQHFTQAAMRAIEQGRYLARSANTSISGIVDPYGRDCCSFFIHLNISVGVIFECGPGAKGDVATEESLAVGDADAPYDSILVGIWNLRR